MIKKIFSLFVLAVLLFVTACTSEKVTVTFDSHGGSEVASVEVNKDSLVTKPSDPTRDGFTFTGWFKDEALTDDFVFESDKVSENITLHAKWNSVTILYDITFVIDGVSETVKVDAGVVPTHSVPTKDGFTFTGWNPSLVAATADATYTAQFEANASEVSLGTLVNGKFLYGDNNAARLGLAHSLFNVETNVIDSGSYTNAVANNTASGQVRIYKDYGHGGNILVIEIKTGRIVKVEVTFTNLYGGDGTREFMVNGITKEILATDFVEGLYTSSYELNDNSFVLENKSLDCHLAITNIKITYDEVAPENDFPKPVLVNNYAVSYDKNTGDSVPSTHVILAGATIDEMPLATKAGYRLVGWSLTADGEKVAFPYTVNADTKLFALWIQEFEITFNPNDGESENVVEQHVSGDTITTLPNFIRENYILRGLSLTADGELITLPYTVTESVTLYCVWEEILPDSVLVTINLNGKEGSNLVNQYLIDSTIDALPTVSYTGHTLLGLSLTTDGELVTLPYTITTTVTLYCIWQANPVVVTFDANGGSAVDAINGHYGDTIDEMPLSTLIGHTLLGLSLTADGELVTLPYVLTEDVLLHLVWELNSVTVTFNGNGGNTLEALNGHYGDTIDEVPDVFYTGHTLLGLSLTADGQLITYPYTLTEDVTLYLMWQANPIVVTFDTNGGDALEVLNGHYGDTIDEMPIATYTDNNLLGWTLNGIDVVFPFTLTNDVTLVAKWEYIFIGSEADLLVLAGSVDPLVLAGHYVLTADITLTTRWVSFGNADNGVGFTGVFDGNGYTITATNLIMQGSYATAAWGQGGFVNYISTSGVIKNLTFIGNGETGGAWNAGFCHINDGLITNCVIDTEIYNPEGLPAGFVSTNNGTISYVLFLGKASADNDNKGLFATKGTGTLTHVYALDTEILNLYSRDLTDVVGFADIVKDQAFFETSTNFAEFDAEIWNIADGVVPTLKKN